MKDESTRINRSTEDQIEENRDDARYFQWVGRFFVRRHEWSKSSNKKWIWSHRTGKKRSNLTKLRWKRLNISIVHQCRSYIASYFVEHENMNFYLFRCASNDRDLQKDDLKKNSWSNKVLSICHSLTYALIDHLRWHWCVDRCCVHHVNHKIG